jgi:hypothetical protein
VKAAVLAAPAGSKTPRPGRQVLAVDSSALDAQIVRGNALAGLKDLDGAIAEYEEAIALDRRAPTRISTWE